MVINSLTGACVAGCPATAAWSRLQSGSPPAADGPGATSCAAGAGSAAGAATGCSPDRAPCKAARTSGSAGCGCTICPNSPNISRTPLVAAMMTSINSGVSSSSPLRKRSKRFSVKWQSVTSSVAFRNPAPPLTVWNPRKISLRSPRSSGIFSRSTSLLSTSDNKSLASCRKSCSRSSIPLKSLIVPLLRIRGCRASHRPAPG
ncbi:hypothetical protein SDC9_156227 [bioreactor metagenome]|uniref:Uncharacterized protein n=1 Tax=bioreactor metagenome TaxID=1076179 RepID=A0A645F686_9ZZZZ